jgi:hypothetical protein
VSAADFVAWVSLVVAFAALVVAWYGIRRSNRTTSAATMVTLNEGFRGAWGRFLAAQGESRSYELAELLNLFEIACAIYIEKSLTGNSRKLMAEYLEGILRVLVANEYTCQEITPLLQTPSTFIFIKRCLKEKRAVLSVTVPPAWYTN